MEERKVQSYHELYALYKFIETLIFREPQETIWKTNETPCMKKRPTTDINTFIQTFPGLLSPTQMRSFLRDDGYGLLIEVGDRGEYRFYSMKMLEHIERHCRDAHVKRRAQRYMDEFHECD